MALPDKDANDANVVTALAAVAAAAAAAVCHGQIAPFAHAHRPPWPSWPLLSSPNEYTSPPSNSTRLCEDPAATCTTRLPRSAMTRVGTGCAFALLLKADGAMLTAGLTNSSNSPPNATGAAGARRRGSCTAAPPR